MRLRKSRRTWTKRGHDPSVKPNTAHEDSWLADVPPEDMRRIVDALYRVHHLISAITDLDTLLERIMEESKAVAQAEACSLLLYDARADELYFHVALGEEGDQQALKRDVRLRLGQGIAGTAAARRESINVADAQRDARLFRTADETTRFKTRSLLAVPLVDHDDLIGVVEVVNKEDGEAFSQTDLRVMEMFSALAASAISNARLIEENLRGERLAAIGNAVAGLAHYARNVISGMSGSVDLIDQGLARSDRTFLERGWPILKRSCKRISLLIEDMLAYSKDRTPRRRMCEFEPIFRDVRETFEGVLMKRTVTLDADIGGVRAPVLCDPDGLFRCLLNLMTNSADAVPAPGGKIGVRAWTPDEGGIVIEHWDNGPGVPPEARARIFEPFFSTKGSHGTGLGLAVTRKIVREHGGFMEVESGPEGGALFRITLPAADKGQG